MKFRDLLAQHLKDAVSAYVEIDDARASAFLDEILPQLPEPLRRRADDELDLVQAIAASAEIALNDATLTSLWTRHAAKKVREQLGDAPVKGLRVDAQGIRDIINANLGKDYPGAEKLASDLIDNAVRVIDGQHLTEFEALITKGVTAQLQHVFAGTLKDLVHDVGLAFDDAIRVLVAASTLQVLMVSTAGRLRDELRKQGKDPDVKLAPRQQPDPDWAKLDEFNERRRRRKGDPSDT
jgi:hypothetical protein